MTEAISRKCPECGDKDFFSNREKGEVICRGCGFVVDDAMFDFGKDRMLDGEDMEKKSRTGAPFDPRVADNLVTEVGNREDLNKLPAKTRNLMKRIRKKNKWSCSALQQNLTANLSNLKMTASDFVGSVSSDRRLSSKAASIFASSKDYFPFSIASAALTHPPSHFFSAHQSARIWPLQEV